MNLDVLLERNRVALTRPDAALTPREARAHDQFAREYVEQTLMTRAALLETAK